MSTPVQFEPGCFYFRRDLRSAATLESAVEIGLTVVLELERLRAWVRQQDMIPPAWTVSPDEAQEKSYARAGESRMQGGAS